MFTFQRLPGLPGTGPEPEQFALGVRGTHSEGLVVRFVYDSGASWVGNFQRGHLFFDCVIPHPDGSHVLLIAGGEGFIIDPETRQCGGRLDGLVQSAHALKNGKLLILSMQDLKFEAHGPTGLLWRTRRLPYDGFRNVTITEKELCGEGWSYFDDVWHRFKVDIESGQSEGGACLPVDAGNDERING